MYIIKEALDTSCYTDRYLACSFVTFADESFHSEQEPQCVQYML